MVHVWTISGLSTQPQRIKSILCNDVGLADHLPVFTVRKFPKGNRNFRRPNGTNFIRYLNIKTFNDAEFITSLKQAPWDTVIVFDEVDDMLQCWDQFLIGALIFIVHGEKNG